MAQEDFYVTFGSNARSWAQSLPGELRPAYQEIQKLQAAITGLEGRMTKVSGPLAKALAQSLPESVAGTAPRATSGGDSSHLSNAMVADLHAAANELDSITGNLRVTFEALRRLPAEVQTVVDRIGREFSTTLKAAAGTGSSIRRVAEGTGPQWDPASGSGRFVPAGTGVPVGGLMDQFIKQTRAAINGQATGLLDLRTPPPPTGIAAVPSAAIDKAGVDRIINAIREQTKELIANSGRSSGSGSTTKKKTKTTGAAADTSQEEQASQSELEALDARARRINAKMNAVIAALGEGADETMQAMLNGLREEEAAIKAEAAALERQQTGKTQRQQKAERRAAADEARASQEVVSKEEKQARTEALARIRQASTLRPELDVGRGTGQYGMTDLRAMADALKVAGFPIQGVSKLRMGPLAEAVSAQSRLYGAEYPAGTYPDALNPNVRVERGPAVSQSVREFLGPLKEWIASLKVLSETARGGADILRQAGDSTPLPGMIHVPEGVTKGRLGYGSGNLGLEGMSALTSVGDPAEVERVRRLLTDPYGALGKEVRARSVQPGGLDISKQYEGVKGIDEEAKAARLYLGTLRRATDALDALASEYLDAKDAIAENEKFIQRATDRLGTKYEKPTDAAKIVEAGTQNTLLRQYLAKVPEADQQLFDDPRFQQGYQQREQDRRQRILRQRQDDSEYRAFELDPANKFVYSQAAQAGLLGRRFALNKNGQASEDLIGRIPGLVASGEHGLTSINGLTREAQAELTASWEHFLSRQFRSLVTQHDVANPEGKILKERTFDEGDVAAARKNEENAAVRLMDTLAKIFGGQTVAAEQLIGRQLENPRNIAQQDRVLHQQDESRLSGPETLTKEAAQERALPLAESGVAAAEKGLAEAQARRAEIEKVAADATKAFTAAEKSAKTKLTKAQQEEVDALREQVRTGDAAAFKSAMRLPTAPALSTPLTGGGRYLKGSLIGNLLANSSAEPSEAALRSQLLGGAAGPLPNVMTRERQAQLLATRPVEGPVTEKSARAGTELRNLQQAEQAVSSAEEKLAELLHIPVEIVSAYEAAQRDLQAVIAAENAYSEALARNSEVVNSLREKQAQAAETEGTATKETVAASNTKLAALKEEQKALQALPHTRDDRRATETVAVQAEAAVSGRQLGALKAAITRAENKGNAEGAAAARETLAARQKEAQEARAAANEVAATVQRLREIRAELNKLKAAAGGAAGGSGSGGGRTATGGARGGDDDSVLRQILAELKRITSTLKGTLKVTGKNITTERQAAAEAGAPPVPRAPRPSAPKSPAQEEAATLQAMAREREALAGIETAKVRIAKADERRNRVAKEQEAAITRAELEEARRLQGLELAMSRLSAATQAEIQKLKQLHSTPGTSARDIVAQQQRVFGSLSADLEGQGVNAAGRDVAARTVLNEAGPAVNSAQLSEIKRQSELVGTQAAQGATEAAKSFFGPQGFWGRIVNTTGTFVVRNFAAGAVFGLTNQLQQITQQAIQTEATFVRVSSALEATGKDIGSLRSDLGNVSTDYGIQLNDVYETAASLSGLFSNSQDLASGTRIVAQLQAISEGALNANEAVGVLASTMSAFQGTGLQQGVDGIQHVADVFTVIQNNLGVNIEDTAEGVSRLAGQAKQMKLSFEETSVFVAQIAKQTNQTGAGAGEQLSRILASLQSGNARTVLQQNFGADVNDAVASGQYGKALENIIKDWNNLNDAQKGQIALSIAGQRQSASFFALMNGGAGTLELLAKAHNSTGAAQQRMDAIMQTLNKRLDVFRTELQNLASNLVRTGILNFLGVMLVVTNEVLDVINKILEAFNGFADENPFLDFLRKSITLLGGAALGMKLLGTSVAGLKEALAARGAGKTLDQVGAGGTLFSGGAAGIRDGAALGAAAEQRALRTVPTFGQYGATAARLQGAPVAEGRVTAPLLKSLGFTLDRTIGTASETYARGLSAASKRMMASSNEFVKTMGVALARDAEAVAGASASFRTAAQGAGSGALGPGGLLRRGANSLDTRAQGYFSRAGDLRSEYNQGVLDVANPFHPRTQLPDPGLLRQAEQAEKVGRTLSNASSATGKVASGFERLAKTGGLADGALIAVGVGLTALIGYMNDSKRAADAFSNALKASRAENAHLTQDQIAQKEYIGPSQDAYNQIYQDSLDKAQGDLFNPFKGGLSGASGTFSLGLKGLGGIIGGGPQTWLNPMEGINRAFGTSGIGFGSIFGGGHSETYGLSNVNTVIENFQKQLAAAGDNADAIQKVQDESGKELTDFLNSVAANDSLSQQQRLAAAAAIDQGRKIITDAGTAAQQSAAGLSKLAALTDDQVQKLNDTLSLLQTTGGRTSIQGLDLTGIYSGLQDDIGASGKLKSQIDLLMYGNLNSVDQQIQIRKILKTEIKNLEAKLRSQLSAGSNADSDAIASTKSQLQAAVGQLSQMGNISDTILQNAQAVAQTQLAQGRFSAGMQTYSRAMQRAARQYRVDASKIGGAAKQLTVAYRQVAQASGIVDRDIELASRAGEYAGYAALVGSRRTGLGRQLHQQHRQAMIQAFQQKAQAAMDHAVAQLDLEIAQAAGNAERVALLELQRARLVRTYTNDLNTGKGILPPGVTRSEAHKYGNAAFDENAVNQANIDFYNQQSAYQDAQQSAADTAAQDAATARQNAAALKQARLGVAQAWADARGDAVASARVQVRMAAAQIAAAKADLAAATDASSRSQALAALYGAQAQMIAAHAAVAQAQADLVSSQYDVSIALAEAAGHTVEAARERAQQAQAALKAALKRSGGKNTAEVNQARASAIQAEAAVRDAKLQDELDTIDFNLQMGRITQSSAIQALRHILQTEELTKAQRRQLLLQIKGMKDELADSQWNFGDIKLPTPYQMRRYIQARRDQIRGSMDHAIMASNSAAAQVTAGTGGGVVNSNNTTTNTFIINGADTEKVRKIIRDEVGGNARVRTTGARRGR